MTSTADNSSAIAAENRLTSASGAGNTASYTYDAQGRRKTKTVNGTTTVFVTDAGNREVLEYDGASGAIQRWYAYGLGSNDVLNQTNVVAGTRAALIPDIQGSVIASLDSSSGTFSKIGYLPYGKSAGVTAPFGYTAQRIDPETNGLYYYRARHYSPAWGRFLQPDPIGFAGGNNLYAYVGNDPLNFNDPNGLVADAITGGFQSYPKTSGALLVTAGILIAATGIGAPEGLALAGAGGTVFAGVVAVDATVVGVGTAAVATGTVLMNQNQSDQNQSNENQSYQSSGGSSNSSSVDSNKLNHIFGEPTHNLDPVVQQFGSQAEAYAAIEQAVATKLGTGAGTYTTAVNIGGANVTVTGAYVNGVPRIGTAFIP